jgi:RNAse (barnase) inhibitor barstar
VGSDGGDGKPVRELDGARFDTLEGFWNEVERALIPGADWGRNLDAFNDILRGGFGTPEGGFVLVWKDSERSRRMLGYAETARWLEARLPKVHPTNVAGFRERLAAAGRWSGETLFDTLVDTSACTATAAKRPPTASSYASNSGVAGRRRQTVPNQDRVVYGERPRRPKACVASWSGPSNSERAASATAPRGCSPPSSTVSSS